MVPMRSNRILEKPSQIQQQTYSHLIFIFHVIVIIILVIGFGGHVLLGTVGNRLIMEYSAIVVEDKADFLDAS